MDTAVRSVSGDEFRHHHNVRAAMCGTKDDRRDDAGVLEENIDDTDVLPKIYLRMFSDF